MIWLLLYWLSPVGQGTAEVASVLTFVDQASRVTAYGLLILFVLAGWKQIVMWRWQHLDIVKEMQNRLDDKQKQLDEANARNTALEAEITQIRTDAESRIAAVRKECDGRIDDVSGDFKQRAIDLLADWKGRLIEANAQAIMWRDAFLYAKGITERTYAAADQAVALLPGVKEGP